MIEKTARKYNLSVVRTYCGHGTGSLFHCAPNIPHYEKNKAVGTMKKGHVGFVVFRSGKKIKKFFGKPTTHLSSLRVVACCVQLWPPGFVAGLHEWTSCTNNWVSQVKFDEKHVPRFSRLSR